MKNRIIPIEKLESLMLKQGDKIQPPHTGNSNDSASPTFCIEELKDRYRLHNVTYRDGLYVVDWSKNYLKNGENHQQQEWIELTKNEEFTLPDSQLCFASMSEIFKNKDEKQADLIEKVKNYFAQTFKSEGNRYRPHTASRAIYDPTGTDEVIHRLDYPDQYSVKLNLIGKDGEVNKDCGFEDAINALLGTENCEETEKVIEWISGKKPYLYRVNNKPSSKNERAVVLGINDYDDFVILADYNILNDRPARGVVAVRQKFS